MRRPPKLAAVVLRCADIEASRCFYERLGVDFVREQHGRGPVHYAGMLSHGLLVELYPTKRPHAATSRLTMEVEGFAEVVESLPRGIFVRERSCAVLVVDPDGHQVQIAPPSRGLFWRSLTGQDRNLDNLPDALYPTENCELCGAAYVSIEQVGVALPGADAECVRLLCAQGRHITEWSRPFAPHMSFADPRFLWFENERLP